MPRITTAARAALNCVVAIALALPLALPIAANAAAPVAAPVPPPPPKPKPNTHTIIVDGKPVVYSNLPGAPVGGEPSAAYEYRTRILGNPGCQRFAADSDAVFLSGALDDKTKTEQLKKIGADATAAGCLGP